MKDGPTITTDTPLHERLRFLAKNSHLPGQRPYTQTAIKRSLDAQGYTFSQDAINNLFKGKTAHPDIHLLTALAAFFRVTVDFFFEDEESYQAKRQYILHVRKRLDSNTLVAARSLRRQQDRKQRRLNSMDHRR